MAVSQQPSSCFDGSRHGNANDYAQKKMAHNAKSIPSGRKGQVLRIFDQGFWRSEWGPLHRIKAHMLDARAVP
jgi:hypothetical protein